MGYRHTQSGPAVPIVTSIVAVGLLASAFVSTQAVIATAIAGAALELLVLVFNRLTVAVDSEAVQASFGWGWPRRRIGIGDVTGFRRVRSRWYYGWGIRRVPRGWMFNVSGLDAVELDLTTGKRFWIGTDEPADLIAALSVHTGLPPTSGT